MEVFQEIKGMVSTLEAAEHYNLKLIRKGSKYWSLCMFHPDNHPFLCIYPRGGFKCYSCDTAGADSIALVSKMYGLPPFQAVQKMIADFNLPVPLDNFMHISKRKNSEPTECDLYFGLKTWSRTTFIELCRIYKIVGKLLKTYTNPDTASNGELFAPLVLLHADLDRWIDTLTYGSLIDTFYLYKELNKKW